LRPCEWF